MYMKLYNVKIVDTQTSIKYMVKNVGRRYNKFIKLSCIKLKMEK